MVLLLWSAAPHSTWEATRKRHRSNKAFDDNIFRNMQLSNAGEMHETNLMVGTVTSKGFIIVRWGVLARKRGGAKTFPV